MDALMTNDTLHPSSSMVQGVEHAATRAVAFCLSLRSILVMFEWVCSYHNS